MIYFTDIEIDQLINEDYPYIDLTSISIRLGSKLARISYATSEDTVICGTEEVLKIFEKFKIVPTLFSYSGEHIGPGIKFLEGEGLATNVHAIWRATANLMEYASGIATRTRHLVELVKQTGYDIPVVTTRKSTPFTKKITAKAVLAGGGFIYRFGLSDTILIFDHHIKFIGGIEALAKKVPDIRKNAAGRNITVEVKNEADALLMANAKVEGIQIDKFPVEALSELITKLRKINPMVKISASGDFDETNITHYAKTGVDMLITSSPHFGRPSDIAINIEPVFEN